MNKSYATANNATTNQEDRTVTTPHHVKNATQLLHAESAAMNQVELFVHMKTEDEFAEMSQAAKSVTPSLVNAFVKLFQVNMSVLKFQGAMSVARSHITKESVTTKLVTELKATLAKKQSQFHTKSPSIMKLKLISLSKMQ